MSEQTHSCPDMFVVEICNKMSGQFLSTVSSPACMGVVMFYTHVVHGGRQTRTSTLV